LQVDRVVTPIWYIIGVTGNTLSAIVWLQRRMHANNSSAVYLVALSISDLLFLLLHFVQVRYINAHSHSPCRLLGIYLVNPITIDMLPLLALAAAALTPL